MGVPPKRNLGISHAVAVAAGVAAAVLVSSLVLYAFISKSAPSAYIAGQQVMTEEKRLKEDITLVYWSDDGKIWLSNNTPDKIVLVKLYCGTSQKNIQWTLEGKQVKSFSSGCAYDPSKYLAVETETGRLILLASPVG
ncbi:MAG: hypothetical protein DRN61_05500 [Thaumarchaeota archaeon]|nr:MAG: hypothetical protein DRN61_05500 [Nitrososphaerota archaeon]